jgi:hypothetical protein
MMSEELLYELAQNRASRRYNRRKLWALNVGGMMVWLAVVALLSETAFATLAAAVFLAWLGVVVVHTLMLVAANSRDKDIESEVARLREAVYDKPKRLELSEDGELVDLPVNKDTYAQRS